MIISIIYYSNNRYNRKLAKDKLFECIKGITKSGSCKESLNPNEFCIYSSVFSLVEYCHQ